ncbi:unnamed protein product [Moneuplotes crassus]|uniref:Uncharacterized protein n=1 Tax=Euplotes crassus TaxID=5936 RepID=A0AAD1XEC7_EUPCR|nr:unnamed protein product [Moneuplotes crassus]
MELSLRQELTNGIDKAKLVKAIHQKIIDEKLQKQRAYDVHLEKARAIEDMRLQAYMQKEFRKEQQRAKVKQQKQQYDSFISSTKYTRDMKAKLEVQNIFAKQQQILDEKKQKQLDCMTRKSQHISEKKKQRQALAGKKLRELSRNIQHVKTKGESLMDDKIFKILEKERKQEEKLKEYKIKKSLQYFDIKKKYESKSIISGSIEDDRFSEILTKQSFTKNKRENSPETHLYKNTGKTQRNLFPNPRNFQNREEIKGQIKILDDDRKSRYLKKLEEKERNFWENKRNEKLRLKRFREWEEKKRQEKQAKVEKKNEYIDLLKLYKQEDQRIRSMMRGTNKPSLTKLNTNPGYALSPNSSAYFQKNGVGKSVKNSSMKRHNLTME